MPSVHKLPAKAFRPRPDEHAQAMALLRERGLTMDALLQACQRFLIANPNAALAVLTPHWPGEPRPALDFGLEDIPVDEGWLGPEDADDASSKAE